MRRSAEEAVRRHEPLDALVRSLEVVAVDEERDAPAAVGEVGEDRARQKLLPQRLPETLHLAERLRVLRPALDVPDALTPQLALEVRLAPPRRVLPPLVSQNLLGRPVLCDAPSQRLHHELGALMVCERVADDEARVVVHEGRQVQPLVASEQEGEDIGLPELVGRRALEAPLGVLASRRRSAYLVEQPFLVQDAPDLRLADAERLETSQHVPDAAGAVVGVLLSDLYDRVAPDLPRCARRALRRHGRRRNERLHAAPPVQLQPIADRGLADAQEPGERLNARPALHDLLHDLDPHAERVRLAWTEHPTAEQNLPTVLPTTLSSLAHLRLSFPAPMSGKVERRC